MPDFIPEDVRDEHLDLDRPQSPHIGRADRPPGLDSDAHRRPESRPLGDQGAHTFAEAAARWLRETEKKTCDKDAYQLAWLSQHIGADPLTSIDIDVIQQLRTHCATAADGTPRSKSTINLYMACLHSVLKKAQAEWGWLASIPKVPMFGRGRKAKLKTKFYLTPAQFEAVRAELPEHLALAAEFAVETGLRMRSQFGLTWDRVDLKRRHAWVPSEREDGGAGQKSGRAFGFTLSPGALAVLERCQARNPAGSRHVFLYAQPARLSDQDIETVCRDLRRHRTRISIACLRAELHARHGVKGSGPRVASIWRRLGTATASRTGTRHAQDPEAAALRLEVIAAYCRTALSSGNDAAISLEEAAWRLSISPRQVSRLAQRYRAEGTAGLIGEHRERPAPAARANPVWRPFDAGTTAAFKAAVRRAGLDPKKIHWHTFRHTFASWAVQSGKVTLQELMVLGDWANLESVLVYAHLAPDTLAAAAAAVSAFRLSHRAG